METTAKCYDNFKLAWMAGGVMHSSMHPTLEAARKAERNAPQPRMVMQLKAATGSGQYAWQLMPGPWADAVKHWQWLALIVGIVVFVAVAKSK
jgi:hypothetical protein